MTEREDELRKGEDYLRGIEEGRRSSRNAFLWGLFWFVVICLVIVLTR